MQINWQTAALCKDDSDAPNLWDGLVGAWCPALGVTGGTLFDVSGRGNDGTKTGNPLWTPSEKGISLELDGASDYITAPSSPVFALNDFTVSILVKRNGWISASYVRLVEMNSYSAGFSMTRDGSGDGIVLWINGNSPKTTVVLPNNEWVLVTGIRKGATCSIYYNTIDETTSSAANGAALTAGEFAIGNDPGASNYYIGQIGTTLLYNRALTPTEIQQHYADHLALFRPRSLFMPYVTAGAAPGLAIPIAQYHYNQMAGA